MWFGVSLSLNAENCEKFFFTVDRTAYVAGESIFFVYSDMLRGNDRSKSKVVYIELFNEFGEVEVQKLFEIRDGKASGQFDLPFELSSGSYIFRAYTNSMRNYGADLFNKISISVYNYRYAIPKLLSLNFSSNSNRVVFSGKVDTCKTRSFYKVEVPKMQNVTWVSASMIPKMTFNGLSCVATGDCTQISNSEYPNESVYPLLSGVVEINNQNVRYSDLKLFLSIVGTNPLVLISKVTDKGDFEFKLPFYSGEYTLVLTSNLPDVSLKIKPVFDEVPFNTRLCNKNGAFEISEGDLRLLLLNAQLSFKYKHEKYISSSSNIFYGKPDKQAYFDEFINLPSLEEYFSELNLNVFVKKSDEHKEFKIFDPNKKRVETLFEPLILVDNVYYPNHSVVLSINPYEVEKIETINSIYKIGDYTFSGIVHILTRDRNLANIELPENSSILNYSFFTPNMSIYSIHKSQISNAKPLLNNTVFWTSTLPEKGKLIEFLIGDGKGEFVFFFQGYDVNYQTVVFCQEIFVF